MESNIEDKWLYSKNRFKEILKSNIFSINELFYILDIAFTNSKMRYIKFDHVKPSFKGKLTRKFIENLYIAINLYDKDCKTITNSKLDLLSIRERLQLIDSIEFIE